MNWDVSHWIIKLNLRNYFKHPFWWGKILGAFLGYLIAGPLGALFGLLVGNFFDRSVSEYLTDPHWSFHTEQNNSLQTLFFETLFLTLGYLAKSDGRVSEQEIALTTNLMQELGLTAEQKKKARQLFNEGKKKEQEIDKVLSQFYLATRGRSDLLRHFVEIQYRLVKFSEPSQAKFTAMNNILNHLGFAPLNLQQRYYTDFFNFHQFHSEHTNQWHHSNSSRKAYTAPNGLDQAYSILEIPKDSSKQEVKRAYRRLMSKHHPDKLMAKGLSEKMIKKATEKTQAIREAYEQICLSKGW